MRYVPELKRNLISLGMLDQIGCSFKAENGCLKVSNGSMVIMKGVRRSSIYVLIGKTVIGEVAYAENQKVDKTRLWHMRLGHVSEKGLQELGKQKLLGGDKIDSLGFCEQCVLGKAKRVKFGTETHQTTEILEYIHSDLWGLSKTPTHANGRYFILIIDDFS